MINKNRLEGAVRSAGYTEGRLAVEIGMTANTFSTKKKNGSFSLEEVQKICTLCRIEKAEDKCGIFLASDIPITEQEGA